MDDQQQTGPSLPTQESEIVVNDELNQAKIDIKKGKKKKQRRNMNEAELEQIEAFNQIMTNY